MQKLNNMKGITLVALVITIIVLIILAGISISLILGENGIVNKARSGKTNYEYSANEEKDYLANAEIKMTEMLDENGQQATSYTITYSAGEGSGEQMEPTIVTIEESADLRKNTYTKANYVFIGWSDGTNTYEDEENITPTGNMNLTAQWSNSLYDLVSVGDYVNINIGYESIDPQYAYRDYGTTLSDTAWRVLDTTNDGKVHLISTGCPLIYAGDDSAASDIPGIEAISNGTITMVEYSSKWNNQARGYVQNGFGTNDIVSLFNNTSVFDGIQPARYNVPGVGLSDATPMSLRNIEVTYWLATKRSTGLWVVLKTGIFNSSIIGSGYKGVRPVASIKSGVTITGGEGTSTSPYTLNGITY